jgi:transcriptional regulator with PAS, ATPase and Fis domain
MINDTEAGVSRSLGDDELTNELIDDISRTLMSQTPSLLPAAHGLALAAVHDVTALITGETGTGKTFLARLIHDHSPRKDQRFVAVPCGALSASLVESELFGHDKGAFTGADRAKLGRFAAAGNGTLLLDEIDTLGLEQQTKLLRVIETGEFEPVGSNDTSLCRARIMAASNGNLEEAVARGQFRPDLFYRLNVMSFHLPPLRERVADIGPLAGSLVQRFARKFSKDVAGISSEALAILEKFPWPGNIRQLENMLQYAVITCTGSELRPHHLPCLVKDYVVPPPVILDELGHRLRENRQASERETILRTLKECSFSRGRTAQRLGVSRVTLYKKIKKYGLADLCRYADSAP